MFRNFFRKKQRMLSGPVNGIDTYTTSGLWTCPAGVYRVKVECWGTGGRSGSGIFINNGAGGDGSSQAIPNPGGNPGGGAAGMKSSVAGGAGLSDGGTGKVVITY